MIRELIIHNLLKSPQVCGLFSFVFANQCLRQLRRNLLHRLLLLPSLLALPGPPAQDIRPSLLQGIRIVGRKVTRQSRRLRQVLAHLGLESASTLASDQQLVHSVTLRRAQIHHAAVARPHRCA